MYYFAKSLIDDRPYRIFVVFSCKVFVRWAIVSHAEMSQRKNLRYG